MTAGEQHGAFIAAFAQELTNVSSDLQMSVVGGLLLSQALTLYTTPVIYLYLHRFQRTTRRCQAMETKQRELQLLNEA